MNKQDILKHIVEINKIANIIEVKGANNIAGIYSILQETKILADAIQKDLNDEREDGDKEE